MRNNNIKIIVCAHKADFCKENDVYMPIHVGKALSNIDLGYIGDNAGDNISYKNKSYCELTGMYWAWKNLKDVEFIGLNHYRRYFMLNKRFINIRDLYITTEKEIQNTEKDEKKIVDIFKDCDIILPKKTIFTSSVWKRWSKMRDVNELIITSKVIEDLYPEFSESFNLELKNNNKVSQYCMFIMPWDEFNQYCKWLFDILFEVERQLNLINKSYYENSRIYGFLAELLINIYVNQKNLKIKYLPVLQISETKYQPNIIRHIGSRLKTEFKNLFNI